MQERPTGTRLTVDVGVECFTKGFAGTQATFDKAVAALKAVDGVLDATHDIADKTETGKYEIELVMDPKKAIDLEQLAATATVETEQKKLIPGRVRIEIAGTLSKREDLVIFEEPAGLKARIEFESDAVRDAVLKVLGDAAVPGTVKGVIEQFKAFEPADPKRKAVVTRITVASFAKAEKK